MDVKRDRMTKYAISPNMEQLTELKREFSAQLERATSHAFTEELCRGELSDSRLFVYLIMDLRFFLESVRMVCRTASQSDDSGVVLRLGKQIGFLCQDENIYFERTLDELRRNLDAKLRQKGEPETLPAVDRYVEFLQDTSRPYAENITALYVFELVYLMWAERADENVVKTLAFKHQEWVRLHVGAHFTEWVQSLEKEVARNINDATLPGIRKTFQETIDLEQLFFDACYDCPW